MLDQLVESRSTSRENTRRSGFLLTVLVIMVLALVSGWTYSLFGKEYGVSDDLDLSQLVAPVPIAEEEPPKPEPEKPEEKQVVKTNQPEVAMRKELIARIDQSPTEPPKVSADKFQGKTIPKFGPVTARRKRRGRCSAKFRQNNRRYRRRFFGSQTVNSQWSKKSR